MQGINTTNPRAWTSYESAARIVPCSRRKGLLPRPDHVRGSPCIDHQQILGRNDWDRVNMDTISIPADATIGHPERAGFALETM